MTASDLALHSSMSISFHDQSSPHFLNICKQSPDTLLTGMGASPGSVINLKCVPSLSSEAVADWVEWGRWGWRTQAKPLAENETNTSSASESAQSSSLNPAAAPVEASFSATEVGLASCFFLFVCLVVSSHHFAYPPLTTTILLSGRRKLRSRSGTQIFALAQTRNENFWIRFHRRPCEDFRIFG